MQRLIQQATHYMQLEQFGEAIKVCKRIISSGENHPQLHLIMAIAYGQTNKFEKARKIFNNLIQHFPSNPDIHYNFALVLQHNNDTSSAIIHYKKCINLNPHHFSALNNTGIIQLNRQEAKSAIEYFQRAIKCQPNNLEYLRNLAQAYYQLNDFSKCASTLKPFLNSPSAIEEDYILIIDSLYKNREPVTATKLYKQALRLFSNNAELLNLAGLIETDSKKYILANHFFSKAVSIEPSNLEYKINQLTAMSHTGFNRKMVLDRLKNLVETFANDNTVYEYAAKLCENLNLLKKAKKYIKKGLEKDPDNVKLMFIHAKVYAQQKHFKKALRRLKNAKRHCISTRLEIDIFYEKAKILDQQKKYKKAWKTILTANKLNQAVVKNTSPEQHFVKQADELLIDFKENFSTTDKKTTKHKKIVFIIGFPRSGTTLIERILSAHPQVNILEETNAINELHQNINSLEGGSYFQKLSQLKDNQISQLQDSYFNSLNEYINYNKKDTIVDKMPMNANHLALISQIFPNAKIILAIRHPFDICISCLMQDMLQVFSFLSATRVYDSYMQIVKLYVSKLNLNIHNIKYEDLVSNQTVEINKLIDFIGLSGHENLDKFYQTNTLVNTPSYQQVNQPIYQQAKYRYKNYLNYIQNETKLLLKWLNYFNYTV